MISRKQILKHAKAQQATDIHVCAGAPIMFRVGGKLVPITKEKLTAAQSREISLDLLTEEQTAQFEKDLDYDLMLADDAGRYRINIGYFNGTVGSTIRILPTRPMTIEELVLPDIVKDLAQRTIRTRADNRKHQPGQDNDDDIDDRSHKRNFREAYRHH